MKEPKMKTIIMGIATLLLLATTSAHAYEIYGYRLPAGNFQFEVNLGPFDSAATGAMAQWNPYLGTSRMTAVDVNSTTGAPGDGISEICWASNYSLGSIDPYVIGYNYPHVDWTNGTGIVTEDDVVLNNVDSPLGFGSYNGYNGESVYDINRIVLHELGHAIGLGHALGTIMNPSPTKLWQLTPDDIAGAEAIYGPRSSQVPDTGESISLLGIGLLVLGLVRKGVGCH